MQINKKQLRQELILKRKAIFKPDKEQADKEIALKLLSDRRFISARTVLCYISTEIEVGTQLIVSHSVAMGKTLAAPKCFGDEMRFFSINSADELEKGAFGIMEPDINCPEITDFTDSICIVPALEYNNNGYRLGYGKGYYDRFLSRYKGFSFGLIYDDFIGEIPTDDFDKAVNATVSETGIKENR